MKLLVHASQDIYCDKDDFNDDEYWDDILQNYPQAFSSAETSVNGKKLPAVFNRVHFEPDTVNIDFGGGKYDNVVAYLSQQDIMNLVIDPYNRSYEHNQEMLRLIRANGGADSGTMANVLNVIREPEARSEALRKLKKLLKPGAPVYIQIYEGSKDSVEGPTSRGYQLNRKAEAFEDEIKSYFPDAVRKGTIWVGHNN